MWLNMRINTGLILAIALLAGCSAHAPRPETAAVDKQLTGTGFSHYVDQTPPGKRWQLTAQAAKLEAYRNLSNQLYAEPLDAQRTVGSQVVADERYREYVDVYLRQAMASDYRNAGDVLKVQMTLTLKPVFYQCMRGDVAQIGLCLQQQNKLPLTRLGYRQAAVSSVNLACVQKDCSDQISVQGFGQPRNPVDNALLNAGLYDSEWFVNTGGDVMGRYFLLQGILDGL
jgi:outer membrane protein FlgP